MVIPAVMGALSVPVALGFGEWHSAASFLALFLLAAGFWWLGGRSREKIFGQSSAQQGMTAVGIAWILASLLAAIPFFLSAWFQPETSWGGVFRSPLNAFFESTSGFTSTGLSLTPNPSQLPRSLQWWRSLLEWCGGLGVVVLAVGFLRFSTSLEDLFQAEGHEPLFHKDTHSTVHFIIAIYGGLTLATWCLFLAAGMPFWPAINHAMAAIATGGFTVTPDSFQGYSHGIWAAAIFPLVMGAIGFRLHYRVYRDRNPLAYFTSRVLRFAGLVFLIACTIAYTFVRLHRYEVSFDALLFNLLSAMTTTGFAAAPLTEYPAPLLILLTMLMMIGGTAGSTVGGIKLDRVLVLLRGAWKYAREYAEQLEVDEKARTEESDPKKERPTHLDRAFRAVATFFLFWVMTWLLGFLLVSVLEGPSHSLFHIGFDVASALNGVGLSCQVVSPDLHSLSKGVFIFLMIGGRLELITLIGAIAMLTQSAAHPFPNKGSGSGKK